MILYITWCWHSYSPFALWLYACSHILQAVHATIHCCLYSYLLNKQTKTFLYQCIQLSAFINMKTKFSLKWRNNKQEKFSANSETVATLIPSVSVPAVGIWNGKICLLKEEWLRLPSSRSNCPPPLKNQAHTMDNTVIFTSALHKLLSCIWLVICKNC